MANDQTMVTETTTSEAQLDAQIDLGGIDDPAVLKAKLQEERDARIKEVEARRQLTARAKAAEEKLKTPPPTITKQETTPRETVKPADILRADEFKLYRAGYLESEIDLIMKNGGMDALKDDKSPLVLGLKVAKEQRQAEEAASRATDSSGTSAMETKYTRADLDKMKPDEIEKVLGFAS